MSELRRDPVCGRWVIVDTEHPNAPEDFDYEPQVYQGKTCPFCYGNESMTPPEIEVFREAKTGPNTSGWQVRVVSNKFPALASDGELDRQGAGIYDMSRGIGAHEVLIETPDHKRDICDLSPKEIEQFLFMYRNRTLALMRDKRFKYIMIFKNFGAAAGASLEHPHTQIIALPMVPKNAKEEIKGAADYFEYRERCIYCDMIKQELAEKERAVFENKHFVSFCPFVSRFPFEIWITPKEHSSSFSKIQDVEIPALAAILKDTIASLKKAFPDLSYNFIVHTSPINGSAGDTEGYHWHIEFMPKLTRVAGFEWGTGFYIAPTPPELAAKYLRDA